MHMKVEQIMNRHIKVCRTKSRSMTQRNCTARALSSISKTYCHFDQLKIHMAAYTPGKPLTVLRVETAKAQKGGCALRMSYSNGNVHRATGSQIV
jgi:hypothetical protein